MRIFFTRIGARCKTFSIESAAFLAHRVWNGLRD